VTANEEWRPVRGFEGLYSVSSLGRVRSEPRTIFRTDGHRQPVRQRLLRFNQNRVRLCRDGTKYSVNADQLAEIFGLAC